jgi:hypothetical protein
MPVIPATLGSINGRVLIQTVPEKKARTLSKKQLDAKGLGV